MDELGFRSAAVAQALPNKAKGIAVVESPSALSVSLVLLPGQSVAHMLL